MDIFDVLSLIGGLSLFLFGMNIMGQALERRAGSHLRSFLQKMTGSKFMGFLTGLLITAVIQSSSATTVMVVGFVNSGLLSLTQAINVIVGANVGTTLTAWILSLSGISSSNFFISFLKPTSFTPILALIGIIFYMFIKNNNKKKDTGLILLGFATLMFGMNTMSTAVSGLKNVVAFQQLFIAFSNPVLGLLAGALLTAIIQSSSASVGILQALAQTGAVTYGATIPIIMGQNIGTCVTALISSVGTSKNAKRAAYVHLYFNIIGSLVGLILFYIIKIVFAPILLSAPASMIGIAIAHSVFNILCTMVLLPASPLLEKLVIKLIPDNSTQQKIITLDERLLNTPPIALEQSRVYTIDMAKCAVDALKLSLSTLSEYSKEKAEEIRIAEDKTDHYEDILNSYLLKLSSKRALSKESNEEVTELLKLIGDFERIGDHAVSVLISAEEMNEKNISFSTQGKKEIQIMIDALTEILNNTFDAFANNDLNKANLIEPLEQVIDDLKEGIRVNHILRMKEGACSVEAGYILLDLLTDLERASDHCSNIAGCVIDVKNHTLNIHESQRIQKTSSDEYKEAYKAYSQKYKI
ncbi:MAG: Na/Pi cotransporter family protein [Eubacteriales bacterium]|nr:Na/Pi cotransporter family protein [Eubacteriales bacterium]